MVVITLLCIICWILYRGALHFIQYNETKIIKYERYKRTLIFHVCFVILHEVAFKTIYLILKTPLPNREIYIRSTHAFFSHNHPKTKMLVGLNADIYISFNGSIEKFASVSYLAETLVRLNRSKRTSLTRSYRY